MIFIHSIVEYRIDSDYLIGSIKIHYAIRKRQARNESRDQGEKRAFAPFRMRRGMRIVETRIGIGLCGERRGSFAFSYDARNTLSPKRFSPRRGPPPARAFADPAEFIGI